MRIHRAAAREWAHSRGVQLSEDAIRELEERVAEVLDQAAGFALDGGKVRITVPMIKRALEQGVSENAK